MVYVKKQPGDSNDAMIRKFQKKVQADGLIIEMKKREFGGKPSAIRKFHKELMRKMAKQAQMRAKAA